MTGAVDPYAAAVFVAFVAVTVLISVRAAASSRTPSGFFAAHGAIGPGRNALALAGDFISAAAFLGVTGLIFGGGYDGVLYAVGAFAGWPVMLVLLAERLRNLGRYTFGDVLAARLHEPTVRLVSAASTLVIVLLYLVGQMVGAGALVATLFGAPYWLALLMIGALMTLYVVTGGMTATTWVQIIKACLVLGAALFMAAAALCRYGWSPTALFDAAAATRGPGRDVLRPGGVLSDPVSAVSLGLALVFGTCGLPHVLMRFFTVADAAAARRSVAGATAIIGVFSVLSVVLGYAALSLLSDDPRFVGADGRLVGGGNMAVLHLARLLGGELFYGFVAAVVFATILAVVSGLTLAGASAVGHDLYGRLVRRGRLEDGREVRASKLAAAGVAALATGAALLFADQNIAFIVSLAVAIAAGVNFPLLAAALYWRGMTARGLAWGGGVGLSLSLILVLLSPSVWTRGLGLGDAPFPYDYPTLFVMPATMLGIWLGSLLDRSPRGASERAGFDRQEIEGLLGREAAARELRRSAIAGAGRSL